MRIDQRDGRSGVTMTFGPPAVYFDHWAIRLFSQAGELQDRFVETLHRRAATFVLSTWNMAEFSGHTDVQNALDAERLLDRLMPRVYVTDFDFERAMNMDMEALEKNLRVFMPPSRWVLKGMAQRAQANDEPLSLRGLLAEATLQRDRLGPVFDTLARDVREKILEMRESPAYVKAARDGRLGKDRPRLFAVLGELQREFIIDPSSVVTTNDVTDMLHAALPAMGCDFVLLDAAWVSRVEKLGRRATEHGFGLPLARCFSRRDDGIERFLAALERFEKREPTAKNEDTRPEVQ